MSSPQPPSRSSHIAVVSSGVRDGTTGGCGLVFSVRVDDDRGLIDEIEIAGVRLDGKPEIETALR